MNVRVTAIRSSNVKNIAAAIARIQRSTGKYGALEKMFFSSFVVLANTIPNGIAKTSAKYSIIRFLRYGCY